MSQLQEAIENITCLTPAFPQKEFDMIRQNYDKAKPLFYEALSYAYSNPEDMPKEYELHFYALLFFGEFQEKDAFEKIMEFLTLPSDMLDLLLGDFVTDGLQDVLYNTYNGNLELLKDRILDSDIDEYVRDAMLNVIGQLYLDGVLAKEDLLQILRKVIEEQDSEWEGLMCSWVAGIAYKCHLAEFLPDVRMLYEEDRIELSMYGWYDEYLDILFKYYDDDQQNRLCRSLISADQIKTWPMFEREQKPKKITKKDIEKMKKELQGSIAPSPAKKVKIGRNDPCPCGSGKKYKFCCMNKPKEETLLQESEEQRKYRLRNYPLVGAERVDGRVYLEDYYDQQSIETDKLIYLAMKRYPISVFDRNASAQDINDLLKQNYLLEAFSRFKKRMEAEQIPTAAAYDQKYSIHYFCREWMGELLELLEKSGDGQARDEVLKYY